MHNIIGIDISKGSVDAYCLTTSKHQQFTNNKKGLVRLLKFISAQAKPLVIFEATGPYHRLLEEILCEQSILFSKVNPKQARRFAQATGTLAKTDQVDSKMLAVMGEALNLRPTLSSQPNMFEFKELLTAKRALTKDRSAAKTRLATVRNRTLKTQLQKRLQQISADIAQIDLALLDLAKQQEAMMERLEILASIPGIGKSTALTILIDMPEIGTMTNKQVGSLAGLAPVSQSSGQWQGKERIQGGRAMLRKSIYMPALVAIRFNADLKAKYDQLVKSGKMKKVAITAVMRKLLVLANALLRNNRKWSTKPC